MAAELAESVRVDISSLLTSRLLLLPEIRPDITAVR